MNSTSSKVMCRFDAQTIRESLGLSELMSLSLNNLMRKKLLESTRKVLMKKKANLCQKSSSLVSQSKI